MADDTKTGGQTEAATAQAGGADPELVRVFGECSVAVGSGIEEVANDKEACFQLDPEAAKYWAEKYWATIPAGLKATKTDWDHDRAVVLAQAKKLGKRAAERAAARALKLVTITKEDVEAASEYIKNDPLCQPAGGGGGVYCQEKD